MSEVAGDVASVDEGVGDADVIIIGAGVIGSALAYELARRGHRTLNIDALPSAGYGSTSCSSAIVRFSYSTLQGVAMSWEALHYWRNWSAYLGGHDDSPLIELVTCGMALLDTGAGLATKVQPHFDALGVPYEYWDAEELARRAPALDVRSMGEPSPVDSEDFWSEPGDPIPGAVWMPDAGYVNDPQLTARNVAQAAARHGGSFRFDSRVVAIDQSHGRVEGVTLDDGTRLRAPVVVNVAGPDSARINDLAGLSGSMAISTRPMRQEVHHLPSPVVNGSPIEHLLVDEQTGIYMKPEAGGMLAIGSLEPACDELEWLDAPDDYRGTVTSEGWERQTLRLARRVPDLQIPNKPLGIVGIYDVAEDWIPIYDCTDLPGFYVAIGTSGNQFKNAPLAGHAMAELIEAVEGGHDHDADPVKVTGRYTGTTIDLGFFSRNREINRNSSFSVCG
ncbi:MAG: FAD-dependent oxidoreductase [Ornithinimicrobium sp.]